jgi:hypothetical protein
LVKRFGVLGRSVGRPAVEGGDVRLDLFHEVEEVAEAGLVPLLALPDPADETRGEPVGARGGLVDALVDAAHSALGDLGDEAVLDEPLDVVVDALLGLVQTGGDLGARARLGQLPQYLDALRFEQRLGLLDSLQVQEVAHHKNDPVRTNCFCQLFGGGCGSAGSAGRQVHLAAESLRLCVWGRVSAVEGGSNESSNLRPSKAETASSLPRIERSDIRFAARKGG